MMGLADRQTDRQTAHGDDCDVRVKAAAALLMLTADVTVLVCCVCIACIALRCIDAL